MRPARSITSVRAPIDGRIAASVPTAAIRPPRTATACAHDLAASTVYTAPFTKTRSAADPLPPTLPPRLGLASGSAGVYPATFGRLRERDELQVVVAPVIQVAVRHQQNTFRRKSFDELLVVAHEEHRARPSLERLRDRRPRGRVEV